VSNVFDEIRLINVTSHQLLLGYELQVRTY